MRVSKEWWALRNQRGMGESLLAGFEISFDTEQAGSLMWGEPRGGKWTSSRVSIFAGGWLAKALGGYYGIRALQSGCGRQGTGGPGIRIHSQLSLLEM